MGPIVYDPSGALVAGGISQRDLDELAPRLEDARREVLDDVRLWHEGGDVPAEKRPLDAAFVDLPDRLLAEYTDQKEDSQLGRILATAARLRESVDQVVVLGIGGSYMGARALMEARCHPYHNQLSRAERGSRPRVYFAGNNLDNDATAGLLDVIRTGHGDAAQDQWAIIVISKSGGTLETAAAFRVFLAELRESAAGGNRLVSQRVVPISGSSGKLFDLARALGCPEVFPVPDGVGGRFSVLSAVGLLPAAVLGLDVVRLLEGAANMNQRFRSAGPGQNPVIDYVAVAHGLEKNCGVTTRVLSVWSSGLEALGLWYDQLLSESLGKNGQGALPLTVVNTRDLHSRSQQHQEGPRDKLITNLIVDKVRTDPLRIGTSQLNQDELNTLAEKTLPQLMAAAIAGTNKAYNDDCRPTADLRLPACDEASLGQLFQMLMLATVLEGRLVGINPYGQPGVEVYKQNMNALLKAK